MKKHLLILSFILLTGLSYGQTYTQAADNSGFTTNCDLDAEAGVYTWAVYAPDGGGGTDESAVDELGLGWGINSQDVYLILEINGTHLDLSGSGNQKIKVTLRNDDGSGGALPLTYTLKLQNTSNTDLLDNSITFATTASNQTFEYDFSSAVAGGQNLTDVFKIIFHYSGPAVAAAKLYVSDFSIGSLVVTGIQKKAELISTSKLYPNPSSDMANVELELKSTADVKVVLTDMVGKEVKVIADETTASLDKPFSVAGLVQGVYTVNYYIDGQPAKSELLMVK